VTIPGHIRRATHAANGVCGVARKFRSASSLQGGGEAQTAALISTSPAVAPRSCRVGAIQIAGAVAAIAKREAAALNFQVAKIEAMGTAAERNPAAIQLNEAVYVPFVTEIADSKTRRSGTVRPLHGKAPSPAQRRRRSSLSTRACRQKRVVVARLVMPSPVSRTMLRELTERVSGGPKRSGDALNLVKTSGSARPDMRNRRAAGTARTRPCRSLSPGRAATPRYTRPRACLPQRWREPLFPKRGIGGASELPARFPR
jgi:hypothetical protein